MNEQEQNQQRAEEARQVQEELERQLRQFGGAVNDAFQHGFEGRGQEIGDRAWDVGRAVVNAANFGISEAGRAIQREQEKQRQNGETAARTAEELEHAFSEIAAGLDFRSARDRRIEERQRRRQSQWDQTSPIDRIRASARKRYGAGLALVIVGGIFVFCFSVGGLSCLAVAGAFTPSTAIAEVIVSDVVLETGLAVGSAAWNALKITGAALSASALPFFWMIWAGAKRLRAASRLKLYASAAESVDTAPGIPVRMLAELTHKKPKKLRKELHRFLNKGWLTAWLDEANDRLFLTAEDYRAAQEARAAERAAQAEQAAAPQEPAEQKTDDVPANLEAARRFAAVLEQEKQLMRDPQGVEELERMEKTTRAICDWLEAHPESLPKARRFADYYIPTTLKLLHTYNDVQGQQGENAAAIRRDIAGILHTLNQAYENLYNNLLSDMALDISGEIAALQGMLANDGLTGEGML